MTKPLKIMLCAVEPSGDALGAALMTALKDKAPDIVFSGCGGPAMSAAGLHSLFDIEPFSVMGPVDALKALPAARVGAGMLADHAAREAVDVAVLIDSWTFSRLVAELLVKRTPHASRLKYVAPQVWASRPERTQTLGKLFDGVMSLFEYETDWLEKRGVRTVCVGHSGFQEMVKNRGGGEDFRVRYEIGDAPLLILAPGSRRSEIKYLSPPFRDAVDRIRSNAPGLRVAIPVAPARTREIAAAFADWEAAPILVPPGEKAAAFDAADAGLVASGTVSTELAIAGTPMAVAYRADALTAAWGQSVMKSDYASLINIAADRMVIPEFIQDACTGQALAEAVAPLLSGEPAGTAQTEAFAGALEKLGVTGAPAAERAAETVLSHARG